MKKIALVLFPIALCTLTYLRGELPGGPAGFDAETLEKVLQGKTVIKNVINTKLELHSYIRAFFDDVIAQEYVELATDHPKFPTLFPEVKEGRTTYVNESKTQFEYALSMVIEYGIYLIPFNPTGIQKIKHGQDSVSESTIENEVTNYKERFEFIRQNTRLIPFQTGILIEEDVHMKMKKQIPDFVKEELAKFYIRYVETFRTALQGFWY